MFELDFLPTMQIHLVFYTNFLLLSKNNLLPGQKLEPQAPVIAADEKYEIDIKKHFRFKNKQMLEKSTSILNWLQI